MFRTQYIPDFVVAEHMVCVTHTYWGSKDLASAVSRRLTDLTEDTFEDTPEDTLEGTLENTQ
jgi:hypothetical protein